MRSSNLAYALRQEQEQEQYQRPIIKALPKRHPSPAVKRRKTVAKTLFSVAFFVTLSAALIYGKVTLTEENTALATASATYADLQSENAQLEETINNMISLQDLETQARALGMGEMRTDQVQTVVVTADNEVQLTDNTSIIQRFWNDIVSYIFD